MSELFCLEILGNRSSGLADTKRGCYYFLKKLFGRFISHPFPGGFGAANSKIQSIIINTVETVIKTVFDFTA